MTGTGSPTLADVYNLLHDMKGEVAVALDRTKAHDLRLTDHDKKIEDHTKDIAGARGQATILGAIASAIVVGLVESSKSLFGGHSGA